MKFPGRRKNKHYFPVTEKERVDISQSYGDDDSFHIVGIDQPLVDIECNVDDSFLDQYQLQKGQSQLIDSKTCDEIYAILKEQKRIKGEFAGGTVGNTLHNFCTLSEERAVLLGAISKNITVGDYSFKYISSTSSKVDLNHLQPCGSSMGRAICFITPDGERTFGISKGCMNDLFKFDRLIPMNSGAEAVETALKLTRRWGYDVKKIPENQAQIIVCADNFHGRTLGIISASTDPDSRRGFGPYLPGFIVVPYGDIAALEKLLKDPAQASTIAGFMVEPIQGEAGVVVPPDGYLKKARELTKAANVLLVADEVQTGLARTGKMLACDHENVKPDLLILGKALSGGVLPISAVLTSNEVMLTLKPGEHGSTFGGNPLACVVARAAMDVILDENLIEQAEKLGNIFRAELKAMNAPIVELVRGRGLLNAAVIRPHGKNEKGEPRTAKDVCYDFADAGLLAKQTHTHIIRFAPPLVITESELARGLGIIKKVLFSV